MSFLGTKSSSSVISGNNKSFRIDDLLQRKKASHNNGHQDEKVKLEEVEDDNDQPLKLTNKYQTKLTVSSTNKSNLQQIIPSDHHSSSHVSSSESSSVKKILRSSSCSSRTSCNNSTCTITSSNSKKQLTNNHHQESSHTEDDDESSLDSSKTFSRSPSTATTFGSVDLDKPRITRKSAPENSSYNNDRETKLTMKQDTSNNFSLNANEYSVNPFLPQTSSSQNYSDLFKLYPPISSSSSAYLGANPPSAIPNSFLLSSSLWTNHPGLENIIGYHQNVSNLSNLYNSQLPTNAYPPSNIFAHPSQVVPPIWTSSSNSQHPSIPNPFHHPHNLHHSHLDPMRNGMDSRAFHPSTSSHLASQYGIPYMTKLNPLLSMGNKRKGGQIRFSNSQTTQLEKAFRDHKYLNANDRKTLAHSLGLSDKQVKTWFQNRRAKFRKSKDDHFYEKEDQDDDKLTDDQEPADRVRMISPSYSPDGGEIPTYHHSHNHHHANYHIHNHHQSRGPTN